MMHAQSAEARFEPAGEKLLDSAIAIVGMSCRFAGARDPAQFWQNLRGGVESVRDYSEEELLAAGVTPDAMRAPDYVRAGAPLEDMACFDAARFGLSPRDAAIMDPQHRHFLECALEALEDAGHTPERFAGAIGVFGGSGHNAYFASNLLSNPALVRSVGAFLLRHTGNDKDFLTTRVSYLLNLRGPSINVQTACSTSLVAIHLAVQHLLNGECDMALAGAASIELPHGHGYAFEAGGILSSDGHCRPFDAQSNGTVFGSGVGIVALRRLRDAVADGDHIHALIRGTAVNNDGAGKVSYLAPGVDGQADVIAEALEIADVPARTIGYVEAHGTGTPVGDPIEVAALTQAFRQQTPDRGFCAIGSVKANIGHTDTAAGVAGLIKATMALRHGELPPTLNFTADNPACGFDESPFRVNAALLPWPRAADTPRRAGISSLGVGGTNAHVVIEEAPVRAPSSPGRSHHLLTVSARTTSALDGNCARLAAALAERPVRDRADIAYSLAIGRRPLGERRIAVIDDGDPPSPLFAPSDRSFTATALADRSVVFMFCGAGSQYPRMGAGLYATEPVFRDVVDACIAASDTDFGRWLFADDADAAQAAVEMERPSIALPALFTIQVALARLWQSWGIQPTGMIGHSSGEYAAAHLAGVITLEDALHIVGTRGRLFETLPAGGMLSVPLAEAELRPLLPPDLSIAAINGCALCVVSGATEAIGGFERELAGREIETRRVNIAVAAHSPMLDPLLGRFRECIASIKLQPPALPFVSNLTGTWITATEATDPDYWVRHLRQTVRFTDGLQQLLSNPTHALLEVGPGRTMASLARQHPARAPTQPVLTSMPHRDVVDGGAGDDIAHALTTLGRLWTLGVEVDWDGYWAGQRRLRVPLPTYAFDRERHWIEPGASVAVDGDADDARRPDIADWFDEPVWRRTPAQPPGVHDGPALIFANQNPLGRQLAAQLRAAGRPVVMVRAAGRFARQGSDYEIRPSNADDYRRLWVELAARDLIPTQIYHGWLLTGRTRDRDSIATAHKLQQDGFYSLLALLQAIAEADTGAPTRIAILSDGMQRVADESWLSPAKATVLGACRVAAHELPDLDLRSIDFAAGGADLTAETVLAEAAGAGAAAVSYRAGERWVQAFEHAPRPETPPHQLRSNGVYLVTGGLGGIGLALARHLAASCNARIALVSRTPMPPRSAWEVLLASGSFDDPVCDRIRTIRGLETLGATVLTLAADIADPRAVLAAVKRTRAAFGRIDGVFHAAGVIDDDLIQLKTPAAAHAVLAPKLIGTLALEQALHGAPPDFMVLFSSISAFAGMVGQVDYAAANAFLDAYAQARLGSSAARVMSIGWSRWQDVGMAATDRPPPAGGAASRIASDHPFLHQVDKGGSTDLNVRSRFSPARDWLLDEHRLADGGALIPGTGFLEIARAAYSHLATGPIELGDILFRTPFAVPAGGERDLGVRVHADGAASQFSIVGRDADAAAGPGWTTHVTGRATSMTGQRPEPLDLAALAARCEPRGLLPGTLHASPFLHFGPRWHNVVESRFGRTEALLELVLPDAHRADLDTIELHPALLDFATAGAQSLIPGHDPATAFFAPMSYGAVRIWAPLPARIFSHIRHCPAAGGDASLASFDVTIVDEHGCILVEIDDFVMVAVRDPALLSATAPSGAAFQDSLTTQEGLSVLDHVLAGAHRPHLIVSPRPLAAALAALQPSRAVPVQNDPGNADDAAPRTPAEAVIAQIWRDLLGVAHIRYHDDFFDLGGHSLLAVQFINRLRKQMGKSLPLAALLQSPTVERLAALIDPEGAASVAATVPLGTTADVAGGEQSLPPGVVALRRAGPATPLFLVHDGLGETLLYRGLALAMPGDRSVYGLEPERHANGTFRHLTIRDMAAAHIKRIRQVQPDGPYLLGGLCAGGVIAFEMAQQLQAVGVGVAFVGILDAADVDATPRRFYVARARWNRLRDSLSSGSINPGGAVELLARKSLNAVRWEIDSRLERRRRARLVAIQGAASVQSLADPALSGLTFLQMYEVAHRDHRPHGLFSGGDVALFMATSGTGAEDDIPFGEKYSDVILGWGKRVADDVTHISLPGGHTSILQPPHVAALATALTDRIDAAERRWPMVEPAAAQRPAETLAEVPFR